MTLVNFTEDGRKNIDAWAETVEKIKALHGRKVGSGRGFLTFSQYDMIAYPEMPDAEATATLQLTSDLEGEVERRRPRAFTMEEVGDMPEELPSPSYFSRSHLPYYAVPVGQIRRGYIRVSVYEQ